MSTKCTAIFYRIVISLILSMTVVTVYEHTATAAAGHPELKAFPAKKEGMERFVIVLPAREGKEDSFKVEIIPGKVMLTDGVNLMRLGLSLEAKNLAGWGYTYYEVTGKDVVMSTMMAPPEDGKQVEAFVAGTPLLVRYNSRLPLVIYAPELYEIRYRIWEAGEETLQAERQ